MIRAILFILAVTTFPAFAQAKDTLSDEAFKAATAERFIGDADAKITIHEYSSLSCGHCANFYANTLSKVKTSYIDNGDVKFIFNDLPTSSSALSGAMLSRCVAKDKYNDFAEDLFTTQNDWAFDEGFLAKLKEKAKATGLSDDEINACLSSDKLRDWIIEGAQEAQKNFGIKSTPSFVINNEAVIRGNMPFSVFKKSIDKALSKDNVAQE